jgi:molybdopterin-guanine dinucleotide biosynthesis protein A
MKKGVIILCGGKSSRMGMDKATLPFGNEVMLQRVVRTMLDVVSPAEIVIVAASEQVLPELPAGVSIVHDQRPGRGPLEGLAAGLSVIPSCVDAVYVTSCDVPLLLPGFVLAIFDQLENCDIAVPADGQFFHPLAAVYRPTVLPVVRALLAADRLRPAYLFEEVTTAKIPLQSLRQADPNLQSLINLNRPEDYEAALVAAGFRANVSAAESNLIGPA